MTQLDTSPIDELRASLEGPLFVRGDAGLADEASGFNLAYRHDPEVLVGAASEDDVAAAVRFAAAAGLPVHVQATGHGVHEPITNGVLITTERLDSLSIDPESRLATIGAGLYWEPVIDAAAEHGLAPITGSSPGVGVVGFLLGGGLGPLARSHGFGSDWVRGFRVVTGAGEVVEASATSHPELFWALRGGKGGLGIVTQVTVELAPLTGVYGGSLVFGAEHIEPVLRRWVEWTVSAPDHVTTSAAIMRMPPLEQVPEPLRGKTLLSLRFASVGDPDEAERLLAPLREVAEPFLGAVGPLTASQISTIHNDPREPMPAWSKGLLLAPIDDEFVTALLGVAGAGHDVPLVAVELRHLGGGTALSPVGGDAVGGRAAAYTLAMVGLPVPELFETVLPGVAAGITEAVRPWVAAESNVNFGGNPHSADEAQLLWSASTLERLAAVRATYDPDRVLAWRG